MVESLTSVIIAAWLKEIDSIKSRCDTAIDQLTDEQLHARIHADINPISTLIRHLSGNPSLVLPTFLLRMGKNQAAIASKSLPHASNPATFY